MSQAKFTKGPWVYDDDDLHGCRVIEMNGYVTMSNEAYYPYNPSNQYDWHLMAAAPEMYEALEDTLEVIEKALLNRLSATECKNIGVDDGYILEIKKTLAKARGEK